VNNNTFVHQLVCLFPPQVFILIIASILGSSTPGVPMNIVLQSYCNQKPFNSLWLANFFWYMYSFCVLPHRWCFYSIVGFTSSHWLPRNLSLTLLMMLCSTAKWGELQRLSGKQERFVILNKLTSTGYNCISIGSWWFYCRKFVDAWSQNPFGY